MTFAVLICKDKNPRETWGNKESNISTMLIYVTEESIAILHIQTSMSRDNKKKKKQAYLDVPCIQLKEI